MIQDELAKANAEIVTLREALAEAEFAHDALIPFAAIARAGKASVVSLCFIADCNRAEQAMMALRGKLDRCSKSNVPNVER